MPFTVEFTDEFAAWLNNLTQAAQDAVFVHIRLLQQQGPSLGRPFVDTLKGAKLANLKELRVQHRGKPLRILFAFDPRRVALLLIGGDKTGDARWYDINIRQAQALYDKHLKSLKKQSATEKPNGKKHQRTPR